MKVLIADDESIIRMDLRETLEGAGHQVVGEAANGAEAVKLAGELGPDVVLLDVKMPKKTGLAAAEQITKRKIAPCIILTAYRDRKLIEKAKKSGAYTFLTKPFNEPELIAAIELATSRFAEVRALEKELADTRAGLEARKLIDRAKGLLMDRYNLKEGDAFRMLQKRAMDSRRTLAEAAREVLAREKV